MGMRLPRDRVEIRDSARQLAAGRRHLNETLRRGEPYLWHMVREVEARGMPVEIALLPAIESAYNPNAYSPSHAVGLWQFLAATGERFGLRRSWWYDGRRDITESTRAALDYLSYLYEMFGDWPLALAAYNSGEGRVQQALQSNRARGAPTDFWSISLPTETRNYVPRLLGLAEILANPTLYGHELAPLTDEPRFEVVELPGQIELELAANLINIDPVALQNLNPGHHRWATDPQGPHRLLVPYGLAERLQQSIVALPAESRVRWQQYVAQEGDSLSSIARSYGVQAGLLKEVNGITGNMLMAGTELRIPKAFVRATISGAPGQETEVAAVAHVIRPGDSLSRIASQHGVGIQDLMRLNKISANTVLRPGRSLLVRPRKSALQRTSDQSRKAAVYYIVQQGDSLSRIAEQFNVSVNDLQEWNKLPDSQSIRAGQRLRVKDTSPRTTDT
jgi:membrane-bound lytic murein transglycosylase D